MKYLYNYFNPFLIFFLILSCSKSQDYPNLELISKGVIEIPLDDKTSTSWWFMQYINLEGEEFLIYHDLIKSKEKYIHFAHLFDHTKSFKVSLALEGPDGIGHLDGFHVRNLDSIFVLNRFKYELNLVDSSGKVKDRFRLRDGDSNIPSKDTALPTLWTYAPVIDLGEKLIIPSNSDIDPFKNDYQQQNLCIVLDLESKSFEYKLGYSDKYFDSGFWGPMLEMPSYTVNYKDSVVLQSFPIEDRVMVYDFDLNLLKSPALFSKLYDGNFHSLPNFDLEPNIFYPHIYSNPSNKSLIFDPYRNLYYRIMSGPYPPETIENMKKANFSSGMGDNEYPESKIMVFDRDFNELGLVDLDKSRYWVDFIRVVEDGILIEVQTNNENKKTFEIFEIKL